MNKFLLISLLLIVPFCHAMYSDEDGEYVPSGSSKRGRLSGSAEQSSYSSDEQDVSKHTRVSGQASVQKGKLFVINISDTTQVNSFPDRGALVKTCMRRLIKKGGITCAKVSDQIQGLLQAQDIDALRADFEDELKQYCMQCPGCDVVLETDTDKRTLFTQVFKHWFLTQQHQPQLFAHVVKLVATNEADARTHFKTHGLPKIAVMPLPQPASQEAEPMDEDDEEVAPEDQEDAEEQQHDAIVLMGAQEEAQANAKWYIVVPDPAQSHMLTVFEAPTQEQVVARYVASKIPHLSSDSPEVKEQGKQLEQNEELTKQLMVQDGKAPKKLVCPDAVCEVMYTQGDNSAKSLVALFEKMALHHMQTHQIEPHNVLSQKATALAAPSFEKAHANVQKK